MTEQSQSHDYEIAYGVDGVVVAVSHVNDFFYNILKNPNLQVIDTTAYSGDVLMGFNYDGEYFIMPDDFVLPEETVPDTTVVSEEPIL